MRVMSSTGEGRDVAFASDDGGAKGQQQGSTRERKARLVPFGGDAGGGRRNVSCASVFPVPDRLKKLALLPAATGLGTASSSFEASV